VDPGAGLDGRKISSPPGFDPGSSSMTAALEGGEWSSARPGRTLPPGKTLYPFYRRLVGPQGRSGRAEILVPIGILSPDRPTRSHSLYRLSYLEPYKTVWFIKYYFIIADCQKSPVSLS